jgi:MoaA/NifB/PqqE/SkfB family radical SAM enzyme
MTVNIGNVPDHAARPEIGLLLWNTCNARCKHCLPSAGPKDRSSLSDEVIFSMIDQAAEEFAGAWGLGLSGGEPFLYQDRLLRIVKHARSRNASTGIVSNGFWATSEAKAAEILTRFAEAGAVSFSFSLSTYHFEHVSPERVANALNAAHRLGLKADVKVVVSKESRLRYVLGGIRRAEPWKGHFPIQPFALLPMGRAGTLLASHAEPSENWPSGSCPSPLLTIDSNGRTGPCCNGATEVDGLSFGNVNDTPFQTIWHRYKHSKTLNRLCTTGSEAWLDQLPPEEATAFRNRKWVNICHLCVAIMERKNALRPQSTMIEQN